MNAPNPIGTNISAAEQAAKNAASGFIAKQENWISKNKLGLVIGVGCGAGVVGLLWKLIG